MEKFSEDIISKAIGIYSILISLIGTFGNLSAALICLKKPLRETPTFIFVGFGLLTDIVTLYFWNVDHFLLAFESYQIEEVNIDLCRFTILFQTTSLQWSAWLLVFMTIDRYLSIRSIKWRTVYFKSKQSIIASISIGLILLTMNASFVLFIDYDTTKTNTTCFSDDVFYKIFTGHIFVYGAIPYILMCILNTMLVYNIKYKHHNLIHTTRESSDRKKSLSFTVLIITTVFIVLTLPNNILNAFFLPLFDTEYGYNIFFLTDCLAFTYHGFNFLLLLITNKRFYAEFKEIMNTQRSNRISNIGNLT